MFIMFAFPKFIMSRFLVFINVRLSTFTYKSFTLKVFISISEAVRFYVF